MGTRSVPPQRRLRAAGPVGEQVAPTGRSRLGGRRGAQSC